MNVDCVMDQDMEPIETHPKAMLPTDQDIVRWQSSQSSCPALEALLMESSVPEQDVSLPECRSSSWDFSVPSSPRGSFSRPGSSSGPPGPSSRARPPGLRSNWVSPPAPTEKRDPSHLIALIQGVSAQVDDNAHRKTRLLARDRVKKAATIGSHRNEAGNSSKGKVRAADHRSLPNLNSMNQPPEEDSNLETLPWNIIRPKSTPFDPPAHSTQTSFPPPTQPAQQPTTRAPPTRSHMPPPPVPISKLKPSLQSQSRNTTTTTTYSSSPNPPPLPPPPPSQKYSPPIKLHPLLHSSTRPKPHPKPNPKPAPQYPRLPQPSSSSASSSSRPPVLGMRRLSPYPTITLPDKQKGFKTPFLKPSPPPLPATKRPDEPARTPTTTKPPSQPANSPVVAPSPAPASASRPPRPPLKDDADDDDPMENERSSSPMAETDSSFSEMSFDMDALEETMKMYD